MSRDSILNSIQVTITGTDRADRITGSNSRELIEGNGGPDQIKGGGGNDFIRGGAGNDTLYGGKGFDVFSFDSFAKHERDFIKDFEDHRDIVDVSGLGVSAADVNIDSTGDTHIVTFDGHDGKIVITGQGFDLSDMYFG